MPSCSPLWTDAQSASSLPGAKLAQATITIRALISSNAHTLHRIRVPDLTWLPTSSSSFNALTELELTYLHERPVDTSLLITHFPHLRGLVLVSAEPHHLAPLAAHPTALPLLDTLDISTRARLDSTLIADFILAKKARLRRLNVMTCDGSLALLDVLPQLPRLEVLGLDLWTWDWGAEHHQRLDAGLPRGLTALLIWDGIAECAVSKDEWVGLVRLPRLRLCRRR